MVLLLLACARPAPAPVVTPAPPPVRDARVQWIDLQGADPIDLLEACLRDCPQEYSGATVPSRTWWSVDWHWNGDDGVPCLVAGVSANVDIVVSLPRWSPPAEADPAVVVAWREFTAALALHEQGHVDMVRAGAAGLTSARRGCGEMPSYGAAILRSLWLSQVEYDVATDHGRTQGARFWGE